VFFWYKVEYIIIMNKSNNTNVFKLKRLRIFFFLIILLSLNLKIYSQESKLISGDQIWGIKGGSSILSGYYGDKFQNGLYTGIYSIPYINNWFMIEGDFTYSYYSFIDSASSHLFNYIFSIGPLARYEIHSSINLYSGISLSGKYLHIEAYHLERESDTFKPGFSLKGGAIFSIWQGTSIRAGYEYSFNYLSEKGMHSSAIFMAVSHNYRSYLRSVSPGIESIDSDEIGRLFNMGVNSYKRGNLKESKGYFNKILLQYKNHNSALKYIDLIDERLNFKKIEIYFKKGKDKFNIGDLKGAEFYFNEIIALDSKHSDSYKFIIKIAIIKKNFDKAEEFIAKKNYFKALKILSNMKKNYIKARKKLFELRKFLKRKIPILEKNAIAFYEKKKYENSILLLKKIKLLDPLNQTVKIYLPRALNRMEAIKNLK
jgi:tetratricopeptide (TPR) repeat protein